MTELEELRAKIAVLERTVEVMAGYINGFGIVGYEKAKRSAKQRQAELQAASVRFEQTT